MFVPILMGSRSDLPHATAIKEALTEYGIEAEIRVASAHKSAHFLLEVLGTYEADPRDKVYMTIAGRSNALSAMADANVRAPVIACPPYSEKFGGSDIFSSLRLPSGVAPAVVLAPDAAALLAAKILGVKNPTLRKAVVTKQRSATAQLMSDDKSLQE